MFKITPIFAAFEFATKADARAAFARCEDEGALRNISVWAVQSLTRPGMFAVVILGEEQETVDRAAAIVMEAPNCHGNYVLSKGEMGTFISRRYTTLADNVGEALMRGDEQIRQRATYVGREMPL